MEIGNKKFKSGDLMIQDCRLFNLSSSMSKKRSSRDDALHDYDG